MLAKVTSNNCHEAISVYKDTSGNTALSPPKWDEF